MTTTSVHPSDWEPFLAFDQTYVTRRRKVYIDAAALLSMLIILISLIPARLVIPNMTDLGRPGLIVGLLLFCWWVLVRFSPQLVMTGPQPMRWAFVLFLATVLISYAVGVTRGLTTMEMNAADRTMLFFCLFTGVALTAADGIPNWFRLRGVLRVLVGCAGIVSAIAVVQYLFNMDLTQYMTIPGLQAKGWTPGFETRGEGVRVASTTTHYIELASYLALILPFGLHFGLFSRGRGERLIAMGLSALIAVGVMTTISRTGILSVGVMGLVLLFVWTWRIRYNLLVGMVGVLAAVAAISPGLVRTMLHLFDDPDSNPAFTVRQERYPMAFELVAEYPWWGRGTGTYVYPQYQVLDNQWLDTLITNGIVGVVALASLHLTGIVLAWLAMRRSTTIEDRHLCASLIATQLIGITVAGTFDSLSFMTYATILATTLGLCGTVWRLTHPTRRIRTSTTRWYMEGVSAQALGRR